MRIRRPLPRYIWPLAVLLATGAAVGLSFAVEAVDFALTSVRLGIVALLFAASYALRRPGLNAPSAPLPRKTLLRAAVVSVVGAALLSNLYWFTAVGALTAPAFLATYLDWLDFVPSFFSAWFVPWRWQSRLHASFQHGTYCFPGPFWWETQRYLRTAVLAYFLLFLGAWYALRAVRKHLRLRRAA
jgi:hypothetical protein